MDAVTCPSSVRWCPAWWNAPLPSGVICIGLLCIFQYSASDVSYTSDYLCDKWQYWLGSGDREKERCKATEAHQTQKKTVSPGYDLGGSHGEEQREESSGRVKGGQSSCWVTQETHPGEIMRRKNTDVKGRASLYNRGWNKIEKTFPRMKDCLPSLPPPSIRTPSSFQGLTVFCLTFFPFTLHTPQCTYWYPVVSSPV